MSKKHQINRTWKNSEYQQKRNLGLIKKLKDGSTEKTKSEKKGTNEVKIKKIVKFGWNK